jgi:hypothetical protein
MDNQDFIFSEFPEIEEDNTPLPMPRIIGYDELNELFPRNKHLHSRIFFVNIIMRLLPREWAISFQAYEALQFYDLVIFIGMTGTLRTEDVNRQIMELCIIASDPIDRERDGNTPIAVLSALKRFNTSFARIPRFKPYLAKFDGKLYALTRSQNCFDSDRILNMFCTGPARLIQYAWKRYWNKKRDQASRVIQQRVLEWLYRPDGPIMKRAETSFSNLTAKQ